MCFFFKFEKSANSIKDSVEFHATNAVNTFEAKFRVHSMAYKGSTKLDGGGKILLPPSALDLLSRMQVSWPVFFYVRNPATNRSTHCGVQEFTADEGTCNMPYWMMQQLGFKEGSLAIIRCVAGCRSLLSFSFRRCFFT